MNNDLPELTFYALLTLASVFWLWGLTVMSRLTRERRAPTGEDHLGATPPPNLLAGTAEVAGQPDALSARAAAALAKQGIPMIGPVKIVSQTADRVAFENMGPAMATMPCALPFQRGEIRLASVGPGKTRVDYAIEVSSRAGLLAMGWVFVGLGLLAIVVGATAVLTYVLPHPNPALRWQAVQFVHTVHFLWPPFLFASLYRRTRTAARLGMDNLVHNLPYWEG